LALSDLLPSPLEDDGVVPDPEEPEEPEEAAEESLLAALLYPSLR
jgi:hypothetical protein